MKQITNIALIAILTLSFDKPNIPLLPQHEYVIKADFQTWIYTYNYLEKIKKTFENSEMPAKQAKSTNDTITMIQNMIMTQIEPQFVEFQKMDSIISANTKKDTTSKKKK